MSRVHLSASFLITILVIGSTASAAANAQSRMGPIPAEQLTDAQQEALAAFVTARNGHLDSGCGTLTQVRAIVAAARREGLLDDEDEESEE